MRIHPRWMPARCIAAILVAVAICSGLAADAAAVQRTVLGEIFSGDG